MGKILVVDDEPLILYAIAKALHDCAEVKTVATAEDALEEVNSGFYDLCFLDIFLPGLNGLDCMKKIQEISPETKVAIMTASHLDEDMKKIIRENSYDFIAKPFNLVQIKEIAKHALQGKVYKTFKPDTGKRRFMRRPAAKTFKYTISVPEPEDLKLLHLEGSMIDISDGGMGMRTDYPLEPGRLLSFSEEVGHKAGIVRWCTHLEEGNAYRAGIQFV
jgi:CheY-like chemotaxis protein